MDSDKNHVLLYSISESCREVVKNLLKDTGVEIVEAVTREDVGRKIEQAKREGRMFKLLISYVGGEMSLAELNEHVGCMWGSSHWTMTPRGIMSIFPGRVTGVHEVFDSDELTDADQQNELKTKLYARLRIKARGTMKGERTPAGGRGTETTGGERNYHPEFQNWRDVLLGTSRIPISRYRNPERAKMKNGMIV